jgi:hypothetical protein
MASLLVSEGTFVNLTTVVIPPDLKRRAMRVAAPQGLSFGEAVRRALEAFVEQDARPPARDPLFADTAVFEGRAPSDLSANHDDHLYE